MLNLLPKIQELSYATIGRDRSNLESYFQGLKEELLADIEAVSQEHDISAVQNKKSACISTHAHNAAFCRWTAAFFSEFPLEAGK